MGCVLSGGGKRRKQQENNAAHGAPGSFAGAVPGPQAGPPAGTTSNGAPPFPEAERQFREFFGHDLPDRFPSTAPASSTPVRSLYNYHFMDPPWMRYVHAGAFCKLVNLQRRPELNGMCGEVKHL